MKGILIKSAIALAILALVHSIFWFFKAGQIEKQVNHFVSENAAYISVGSVAISGFPLSQKVSIQDLRFVIPNSALDEYQTTIKQFEAKSSIFSNDFTAFITDQVLVQNLETTESGYIEFSDAPEIKLSIDDSMITKFIYKDSGYRILDAEKVVIYQASSSDISFSSAKEGDTVKNKIKANIKDIEGFDVLSVYKNAVERKIVNGIKTGEISIGNPSADLVTGSAVVELISNVASIDPAGIATDLDIINDEISVNTAENKSLAKDVVEKPSNPTVAKAEAKNDKATDKMAIKESTASQEKVKTNTVDTAVTNVNSIPEPVPATAVIDNTTVAIDVKMDSPAQDQAITDQNDDQLDSQNPTILAGSADAIILEEEKMPIENVSIKSNLNMDIEYALVPSELDQKSESPLDKTLDITQIQDSPVHYSKIIKVNNFEFSNSLYKITVDGQMNIFQDDSMPSGAITAKVENLDNLINFISDGLNKIANQENKTETDLQTSELPIYDDALDGVETLAQAPKNSDPYQDFLKRITANLNPITKELTQKNPLTTDDSAVFDIRREKNLEILVNETPVREILGKI